MSSYCENELLLWEWAPHITPSDAELLRWEWAPHMTPSDAELLLWEWAPYIIPSNAELLLWEWAPCRKIRHASSVHVLSNRCAYHNVLLYLYPNDIQAIISTTTNKFVDIMIFSSDALLIHHVIFCWNKIYTLHKYQTTVQWENLVSSWEVRFV